MSDRLYQDKMISDIYGAWAGGARDVLAVLPTGGGKSVVLRRIIAHENAQGARQSITAHRNELVAQLSLHIATAGVYHRIIAPRSTIRAIDQLHREEFGGRSFINQKSPCSVAGVDTLISRAEELAPWANTVNRCYTDEGHHVLTLNKWGTGRAMFPNAWGLGVTASPSRADGQGLGRHADGIYDVMVEGPTMRQLIDDKYLCDYELVCPKSDIEISDDDITPSGDFSPKKLAEASKRSHIVGDVVEQYCRYALGKRTIVFVTDVETAGKVAANFKAFGIAAEAISAKTPDTTRIEWVKRFRDGRITVLVNVDLFGEGFDCLDMRTEVLTPNGWKDILTASFEKDCYAWNKQTHAIEIVPIDRWGMRPVRDDEQMWTVTSQHADIRVTEGHRIYMRGLNHFMEDGMSRDVRVATASEVHRKRKAFAIPLAGECDFPGIPLSDDEIRVIGWYLTDGCILRKTDLTIAQSKTWGVRKIQDLLNRLGWKYRFRVRNPGRTCYPNSKPCVEFAVGKRVWGFMSEYLTKQPSSLLHDMTRHQFSVLWEALMDGDGSRQKGKSGTLTCANKAQADCYVHMATVRGFAATYGTYETRNGVTVYTVRARDQRWLRMKPTDRRGAKFNLEPAKSGEFVWCLTNRLGTLITRRNGKIAILGNCPATDCVVMARPTASLAVYLQQFGRGLRIDPGNPSKLALIIDMVSNWKRHGFPDKSRAWTLDRRDKRAKRQPDPEDIDLTACVECSRPYERCLPACPHCGHEPVPAPSARGNIEQIDGDLFLLDRNVCAQLRAATELPAPADVAAHVGHAAGALAAAGALNRQLERIQTQQQLRETIALWAGHQRARGRSDRESHKRFYLTWGCDVLSALAMPRADMEALNGKILEHCR